MGPEYIPDPPVQTVIPCVRKKVGDRIHGSLLAAVSGAAHRDSRPYLWAKKSGSSTPLSHAGAEPVKKVHSWAVMFIS